MTDRQLDMKFAKIERLQKKAGNLKNMNVKIEEMDDGTFKIFETDLYGNNTILWTRYKKDLKEVTQELKELKEIME